MKTIGRVGHALSLQHVQVLVDQEEVAGADLVEAKAQALGVECRTIAAASGDLAGQARIVPVVEQDATGEGELLRRAVAAVLEIAIHLLVGLFDQLLLAEFKSIDRIHGVPPRNSMVGAVPDFVWTTGCP